jgi:hypothetical protein
MSKCLLPPLEVSLIGVGTFVSAFLISMPYVEEDWLRAVLHDVPCSGGCRWVLAAKE